MRKVAIVAKAGTSALAPWHSDWEIWGMPWIDYPRVDVLFDIHSRSCACATELEPVIRELQPRYRELPVYCDPSRLADYPKAIEFPLEEVKKVLPFWYLENTIAYQLAFAIHQQVDTIGLWGVHMMGRNEFAFQRPSVTYLIGLAQGRGIEVQVVPGSPLFMSGYIQGRYGVTDEIRQMPSNYVGK